MSTRSWKEARRHAKAIARDMDRTARLARKVPRWRATLLILGFKGFTRRWLVRWEEKHKKALAKSLKKTTHFIIEEDRKMRQGPQPLPKHMRQTAHEEISQEVPDGKN